MKKGIQYTIVSVCALSMTVGLGVWFGVQPRDVEAQMSGMNMGMGMMQPFGGRTQTEKRCTCSNGCSLLTLGGPKGGDFMWCPSTRMYQYYNHSPMAWQLGLAGQYMPCMVRVGYYCVQQGGGPLMHMDGTSQY